MSTLLHREGFKSASSAKKHDTSLDPPTNNKICVSCHQCSTSIMFWGIWMYLELPSYYLDGRYKGFDRFRNQNCAIQKQKNRFRNQNARFRNQNVRFRNRHRLWQTRYIFSIARDQPRHPLWQIRYIFRRTRVVSSA